MNRQSKGWLGEGAVYRFYADRDFEVWNLAPAEPAADLMIVIAGKIDSIYEVKYRREAPRVVDGVLTEPRFGPDYKRLLEARRLWCEARGYYYGLWIVRASKEPLLPAVALKVLGLGSSKTRTGLTLKVFEVAKHSLKRPEMGHITGLGRLAPRVPPKDGEEE